MSIKKIISISIIVSLQFVLAPLFSEGALILCLEEPCPPRITVSPTEGSYEDEVTISFTSDKDAVIYFTTNGSVPNENSLHYSTPFNLDIRQTTTLKFYGESSDGAATGVQTYEYYIYVPIPDTTPPTAPTSVSYQDHLKTTNSVSSNEWFRKFTWVGAKDNEGGEGLAGYWVYFGKNASADPTKDGSFSNVSEASFADIFLGETYYLIITAEDNAGNLSSTKYVTFENVQTSLDGVQKDLDIPDGALIRAEGDVDVYIVKYVGNKRFKRLVLSPTVFNSYGHLRWDDIMDVPQATVDEFTTSNLVRATVAGDPRVYQLFPQGDTGQKRWVKTAEAFNRMGFDWDAIYTINEVDRDSYIEGASIE